MTVNTVLKSITFKILSVKKCTIKIIFKYFLKSSKYFQKILNIFKKNQKKFSAKTSLGKRI